MCKVGEDAVKQISTSSTEITWVSEKVNASYRHLSQQVEERELSA